MQFLIDVVWINRLTRTSERQFTATLDTTADAIECNYYGENPTPHEVEKRYEELMNDPIRDWHQTRHVKVVGVRPCTRTEFLVHQAANGLDVDPASVKAAVRGILIKEEAKRLVHRMVEGDGWVTW